MISTRVLLLSLLFGSAAFAAPMGSPFKNSKEVVKMSAKNSSSQAIAGAAYFMTNEPAGNFIVAAELHNDGSLRFDKAVSTRGLGQHGITDPNGPDPLFSQGAVKASATGKVLAAVNAGSNTVSLFSIDPKNPINIKLIGQPVSSEGEFPLSLAFNKDGSRACVLNGGAVNNVNCYKVDSKLGLVAIPQTLRALNINQTTPATGPGGSASHLIFSEDNTKLIASVKGTPPNAAGFFAVWDVASDGTLSKNFAKVDPPKGGLLPFGMAVIPGMNALVSTDAGLGFETIDLSSAKANSNSTSNKDVATEVKDQKAVCWVAHSGKTGNFYMTDIGTSKVTEVSIDSNLKATIVKQYQQTENSATTDDEVATLNNKDFLYVLQPNATSVAVLRLDAPGNASNVGNFNLGDAAKSSGLTVNANNLAGMTTFVTQ